MAYLALAFQLGQLAPSLLNIRLRIWPVNLVEVNIINAQAFEAGLGLALDRVRLQAITYLALLIPDQGTLGEDKGPLTTFDGLPNDLLRMTQTIHGSGIDPVNTQVQAALNGGDRLLVILRTPAGVPTASTHGPRSN